MPSKLQSYMQMADEAQRQITGSFGFIDIIIRQGINRIFYYANPSSTPLWEMRQSCLTFTPLYYT